jgi:excisionase family DNA binding protein
MHPDDEALRLLRSIAATLQEINKTVRAAAGQLAGTPASSVAGSTLTVEETCQRLKIGRTLAYELMDSGELPFVLVGKRRRICVEDLQRFIAER